MDKQTRRERVWDALEAQGVARFPFPPHGRIPNFAGADVAAARLAETDAWAAARTIKANPDAPQRPVRRRALEAGKTVYVAVPRLREPECFLRLDPAAIDDIDHATTISGADELGEAVAPAAMDPIDVIVSGSVAVSERGDRVGKGEGYSDLEFAILREFGLVSEETTTATTVHELQVFGEPFDMTPRDVPMDVVVTPERTIQPRGERARPTGIAWEYLDREDIEAMPILSAVRDR